MGNRGNPAQVTFLRRYSWPIGTSGELSVNGEPGFGNRHWIHHTIVRSIRLDPISGDPPIAFDCQLYLVSHPPYVAPHILRINHQLRSRFASLFPSVHEISPALILLLDGSLWRRSFRCCHKLVNECIRVTKSAISATQMNSPIRYRLLCFALL